jgi:hypothetical protein
MVGGILFVGVAQLKARGEPQNASGQLAIPAAA